MSMNSYKYHTISSERRFRPKTSHLKNDQIKLMKNPEFEIFKNPKFISPNQTHRKLKVLPDSKRTLIPSLRTEEDNKKDKSKYHKLSFENNKSCGLLNPNSFNPLISYQNSQRERRELKGSQSHNNTFKLSYDEKDLNQKYKREKGESKYEEYKTTTQIYSLPGGVKRKIQEKTINPLYKESIDKKLEDDYMSKIICLPNTETRDIDNEQKYEMKKQFRIQRNNNINNDFYLQNQFKNPENIFRKGKRSFRNIQNNDRIKRNFYPGFNDQFQSHFILG